MLSANEYQILAARTIDKKLTMEQMEDHALKGMVAEVGELNGIYQKVYQGHKLDEKHLKKETGDILWFIAEYCTANAWDLGEIMNTNIEKLKDRYPDGFEVEKSLHRRANDI